MVYIRIICLSFLILLFVSSFSFPQTGKMLSEDATIFYQTGRSVLSSPFSFNQKDWIIFGGITGLTAFSTQFDKDVKIFSQNLSGNKFTNRDDEEWAVYSILAASIAVYIYGITGSKESYRETGVSLISSVFYSGLITSGIKFLTGRNRPYVTENQNDFSPFSTEYTSTSFPSGHSTLAFTFATVLANRTDNLIASIGLYSFAGYIALSRVYHNQHWLSDILFGAAIGYFVGRYIEKETGKKFENIKRGNEIEFPIFIAL